MGVSRRIRLAVAAISVAVVVMAGGCSSGETSVERAGNGGSTRSSGRVDDQVDADDQVDVEPPPSQEIDADGPDPAVLVADGAYWMFTTSSDGLRIPLRRSTDSGTWSAPKEALEKRPAWAGEDDVWAPGVVEVDGRFVLWFGSPTTAGDNYSQCIGVAVADNPGGPYTPIGDEPVICSTDGPTIDPFPWRAGDGRLYLAWTEYHYESGKPTEILASALDETGTRMMGERSVLLTDPSGWETIILENPALFDQDDGSVRLLYSGNLYFTADYATGTATCDGPLGPCRRDTPGRPWFERTDQWKGPGGMSVFHTPDGERWTAFHAWGDKVGYAEGGRRAPHAVRLEDLPPLP